MNNRVEIISAQENVVYKWNRTGTHKLFITRVAYLTALNNRWSPFDSFLVRSTLEFLFYGQLRDNRRYSTMQLVDNSSIFSEAGLICAFVRYRWKQVSFYQIFLFQIRRRGRVWSDAAQKEASGHLWKVDGFGKPKGAGFVNLQSPNSLHAALDNTRWSSVHPDRWKFDSNTPAERWVNERPSFESRIPAAFGTLLICFAIVSTAI